MEGSAAEDPRMVHAQTADFIVGGGSGADFALVDSGGGASGTVLIDDWKVPRLAGAAGVGGGVGRACAALRGCGVARLLAWTWESAERHQHVLASGRADDDDGWLGGYHLVELLGAWILILASNKATKAVGHTIVRK